MSQLGVGLWPLRAVSNPLLCQLHKITPAPPRPPGHEDAHCIREQPSYQHDPCPLKEGRREGGIRDYVEDQIRVGVRFSV